MLNIFRLALLDYFRFHLILTCPVGYELMALISFEIVIMLNQVRYKNIGLALPAVEIIVVLLVIKS